MLVSLMTTSYGVYIHTPSWTVAACRRTYNDLPSGETVRPSNPVTVPGLLASLFYLLSPSRSCTLVVFAAGVGVRWCNVVGTRTVPDVARGAV